LTATAEGGYRPAMAAAEADPIRFNLDRADRARVDKLLAEYLKTTSAICVLLVDRYGETVTVQGDTSSLEMDIVSALVAGAAEVSHQMAKALKKDEFQIIFHEGAHDNVQIQLVGKFLILGVVFDSAATLGMVRLYAKQLTAQLDAIFHMLAMQQRKKPV